MVAQKAFTAGVAYKPGAEGSPDASMYWRTIVLAKNLKEGVLGFLQKNKGQFFSTELLATKLATENSKFISSSKDADL